MLFPLEKLLRGQGEPLTVRQDDKVAKALELMIAHDFSQLPVVDADGRLTGLISEQSIARTYYHQKAAVSLLDLTVDHCRTRAVTIEPERDLFEALDRLREVYAVVVVTDGKPYRILTDYDTTHFFRDLSEGLILVEDVETTLRQYIESALPDEKALEASLMRAFRADKRDPSRPGREYDELTFAEHIQLIATEDNWECFDGSLEPKKLFLQLMEQVGQIRNQLAHFRGQLDPVQRNALAQARDWLASRPKLLSAETDRQRKVTITPDDLAARKESKQFNLLLNWFLTHGEKGDLVRVFRLNFSDYLRFVRFSLIFRQNWSQPICTRYYVSNSTPQLCFGMLSSDGKSACFVDFSANLRLADFFKRKTR